MPISQPIHDINILPIGKRRSDFQDHTGKVFNRLTVLGYGGMQGKSAVWYCQCECGTVILTQGGHLVNSTTRSCGCYTRDRIIKQKTTHNAAYTSLYCIYGKIKDRCLNPNSHAYPRYGGRGIECRFSSFEDFRDTVGERPSPDYTIDRIDNDGHYEKGNLRWATRKEQQRNTVKNVHLTINGTARCMAEWAEYSDIPYSIMKARRQAKWCDECIVFLPKYKSCTHRLF